jgi:multiple sugar transport system permease protein
VPVALLWVWIFNPQYGLLNVVLRALGIQGPAWLVDPAWVLPALIVMSLWGIGGSMIIYLAGLQGIPTDLYEAAEIDGAGEAAKFRHITLPLLTAVIFFNLITGVIYSLQTFTQGYLMFTTPGGPENAALFYVVFLYQNAFQFLKMGYASALAWVLFAIIIVLTLLLFRSASAWVYYEGERAH